jgi:predicted metal-dependent HD superfamily phosphohydrolase
MIPTDIVHKAAEYVTNLFEQADTKHLYFHSLDHTKNVVQHAVEIGQRENVSEEELSVLQVAAWFHDVGHLQGGILDHEMRSVEELKHFLIQEKVDDPVFIQQVSDAIMATRMPHVPGNKLGEIMCDADVYHFGTSDFRKTNKKVKKELKARSYPALVTDWPKRTLKLLQSQHFFTPYSRQKLEEGKAENIRWLKKKVAEAGLEKGSSDDIPEVVSPETVPLSAEAMKDDKLNHKEEKPGKGDKDKQKDDKADKADKGEKDSLKEDKALQKAEQSLIARGMQTILRLGSSNHLDLSRMADGKANILISVNSIIISVILSFFIDRLDADPYLTIPTILFLTSSVITVIIAILATRPKLTEGTFTREAIQRKEVNLIFFGNFYKSSLEDYTWAMSEMMKDKDYLYDTLVKDIYYIGIVLGRKYKLIRLAYNVFMIGLIVAVLSFTIASVLNTPSGHTTVINANSAPL